MVLNETVDCSSEGSGFSLWLHLYVYSSAHRSQLLPEIGDFKNVKSTGEVSYSLKSTLCFRSPL
jgi:hypothetical protein